MRSVQMEPLDGPLPVYDLFSIMRKYLAIKLALLCITLSVSAQSGDLTLTTTGTGPSVEEAVDNALRSAIEQAYGAFISSDTRILNDELIQDEIVSISSGNILSYLILSVTTEKSGEYYVIVSSTLSVRSLSTFVENRGGKSSFKGGLLGVQIRQQVLNESNELTAISDLVTRLNSIVSTSFDYSIEVGDPSLRQSDGLWAIPLKVKIQENENFKTYKELLFETLKGLSMPVEEADQYRKLNKSVFPVSLLIDDYKYGYFILRSEASFSNLVEHIYSFNESIMRFHVQSDVARISPISSSRNNQVTGISDDEFISVLMGFGNKIYGPGSSVSRRGVITPWWTLRGNFTRVYDPSYRHPITGHDVHIMAAGKTHLTPDGFEFMNELFIDDISGNRRDRDFFESSERGQYHYGLVMDLSSTDEDPLVIYLELEDRRTTEEISQITEYKVLPSGR